MSTFLPITISDFPTSQIYFAVLQESITFTAEIIMSYISLKNIIMPQATLPLFTHDMSAINLHIGVQKRDGKVYYFSGCLPFYHHMEGDRASFKHVVCQMLSNGNATRAQLSHTFRIPERTISRWMDTFTKEGEGCFFKKKKRYVTASSHPKQ
jgi:hypothetical protein